MKPTTPQEYAAAYGIFIADLLIAAKPIPKLITWFNSTLSDVALVYKTDPAAFSSYQATITSFPYPPKGGIYARDDTTSAYNLKVTLDWTSMTNDLKAALAKAEVDPSQVINILASFARLKPASVKGGYK